MPEVRIGKLRVEPPRLLLVAGPCVLESLDLARRVARKTAAAARDLEMDFVFKASYDKANRTSARSYRGPGLEEGLRMLEAIRGEFDVPVLTDVHSPEEARAAADAVDVLQIPAFLCRQTDLLTAAAKAGKAVNVKKGQFVAPGDMRHAVDKIAAHNPNVLVTERGFAFGYHDLVADMRALAIMRAWAFPVLFDATHAVQRPGGGVQSGGDREFVPVLARAAAGAGIDGLFLEVHPDPARARSDADVQVPLERLRAWLGPVAAVHRAARTEA